jgi:hypothetical protein
VDLLSALGRTIPFAFTSGINLYATVAVLGVCYRYHLVALPAEFEPFSNPMVITAALAMYAIEFVADKVPWLDSVWDLAHTVVRPLGGALVAITALGHASPGTEAMVGLLGGSIAAVTHLTKAGTRAAANTTPEPFSNWLLSLAEDAFVVGFSYLALRHPIAALTIACVLVATIAAFASVLVRAVRRRFRRQPAT